MHSLAAGRQNYKYTPLIALIISFSFVFLTFAWQGNKGFSLWDEGYLWYGVQRVLLGEVPIRDFLAYDPGRYYWSAALLSVYGDNGIMALRGAVAIMQALGLFVGVLLIAQPAQSKPKADFLYSLIAAAVLVLWMFPRHKLFDISLSIFLIGLLTYLIKKPEPKRYLFAGIGIGLVAVFGRNHGMYGAAASLGVLAWLQIKNASGPRFLSSFAYWAAGVAIGFLPVILMALFVPGFAVALWESVYFLFEIKATNLPLPIPWPWTADFANATPGNAIRTVLIGVFFIGTVAFGVFSIAWVMLQRIRKQPVEPVLVAAAFLALPYAHFAFSRADVGHLAQGIFPLLIGTLVLAKGATNKIKWPLAAGLLAASFWVMHVFHPGWHCLSSKQCVNVEISGSNLLIDPGTAADIKLLRQLATEYAPDGRTFVMAPFWPGAYALLERRSPMWEIYPLFPRPEAFELKEIERIKSANPGFAFIIDSPLDDRDDLRFKNTHPLINQYITTNFDQVPELSNHVYKIYKARGAGQ